eukprot:7378765-Prymnesium_polylepis.2
MLCSSPPILRSNGTTVAESPSWIDWSATSPSRRGPAQMKAIQLPLFGMPSICGVRATPADGVGL